MSRNSDKIFSATYSNVPVYEYLIPGSATTCMRRRSDDWINATHILKAADYDKPARTRILEREVQKGVHEKVQGGYGKYQGTWIPLQDGRDLAAKNGVLEKLLPIFEFVPGDRTPPPAPKHATAASKPRQPRAPAGSRRQPGKRARDSPADRAAKSRTVYPPAPDYDAMDMSIQGGETPDNETVASESAFGDYQDGPYSASRKRRRIEETMSQADKEHQLWADELLDFFMLADNPEDAPAEAPKPPPGADLNRAIDDKGHTALHWAAAMGDLEVIKDLIRCGAAIDIPSKNGETPLMRAVVFTNNYDKLNMQKVAGLLVHTVSMQEWYGETVFHHIANSTQRKSKYQCARYYMDCILDKMSDVYPQPEIARILDIQDSNGDTAITIAARNGARKCVRSLIGRGASVEIPNTAGETADQLIVQLNHRRRDPHSSNRQMSSSPFQIDTSHNTTLVGGPVQSMVNGVNGSGVLDPLLASAPSQNSALLSMESGSDLPRSESALALASSVQPSLNEKVRELAYSIDSEVLEKEAELAEAERVVMLRRHEIEVLHRQAEEIRAKEAEQLSEANADDEKLLSELDELVRECHSLTEEEENLNLRQRIREEERALQSPSPDGIEEDEEETATHKLELANELRRLIHERKELLQMLVENLSVAGVGDRQGDYKRLIRGALGVQEEDVDRLLPEIMMELEDYSQLGEVGVA